MLLSKVGPRKKGAPTREREVLKKRRDVVRSSKLSKLPKKGRRWLDSRLCARGVGAGEDDERENRSTSRRTPNVWGLEGRLSTRKEGLWPGSWLLMSLVVIALE